MTNHEIVAVPWAEATGAFTAMGLPEPPQLDCWPDRLFQLSEHSYGTFAPETRLYDFDQLAREVFNHDDKTVHGDSPVHGGSTVQGDSTVVVLGLDGHGFQSWAAHLVLRTGPLLAGFQISAGGFDMPLEESAQRMCGAWGFLQSLVEEVENPAVKANLPAGRKLVVLSSNVFEDRWGWLEPGEAWQDADWHDDDTACLAALFELRNLRQES